MITPLTCSLNEFLCEANGPDPWCRQSFSDYINDIDLKFMADEVDQVPGNPCYGLVSSADSALLVYRSNSSISWESAQIVGYYNTPGAVCIREDHQGQGLGSELVLWTAINFAGGPPTEGLDEQCFSKAGYAAHVSAWHLGIERGLILDQNNFRPR